MGLTDAKIIGLSPVKKTDGLDEFGFAISDSETILFSYKAYRSRFVITDKKILCIAVQGISGKKVDYTIVPLKHLISVSCESAGTFDLDAELKIWASGIGCLQVSFVPESDIKELIAYFNEYLCQ